MRELLRIAWPLALSGFVTVFVAGNDTVLLGLVNADAIAAAAAPIGMYLVVTVFLTAFSIPAQILAARHQGAGDSVEAARSAARTGTLAVCLAVPISLMLIAAGPWLVSLITADNVDTELAGWYVRILAAGVPLFALTAMVRGFAVGIGRSRIVLLISSSIAAVDIGTSILLLALGAGALGIAAGTTIGVATGAGIALAWLRRTGRGDTPVPHLREILSRPTYAHREAWTIGWPEGLMGAFSMGSLLVVTVLIAPSGPLALATVRALDVMVTFAWVVVFSAGSAGTTLLAQRIGAGDVDGLRQVVRRTLTLAGAFAVTCAVVMPLVSPALLRVAIDDARVAENAAPYVWIAWAQVLWMACTVTTNAIVRAHGDTKTPLKASLIGEYAVFLPLGWLLCRVNDLAITGVFIAHHVYWATFLAIGANYAVRHLRRTTASTASPAEETGPHSGDTTPPGNNMGAGTG
ncbi:MATE family efflux transporter [Phytoactinopolyspora mesophila]|uniref:MATE family efflux transporter n=1 Tax=Phytoactinopolyspora mesophila TaxID=2650750 RepID=UPI00139202FC